MKKKILFIALTVLLLSVGLIVLLNLYRPFRNENGLAVFRISDESNSKSVSNASIIIMDNEKVFKTDSEGKAVVQLENKPNSPKQFMGYTVMVIADGYLPTILYNVGVYPAAKPEEAMSYTISLKKPEAFNNASYYTEFLPTSNTEMAGIIEYYKSLIKH